MYYLPTYAIALMLWGLVFVLLLLLLGITFFVILLVGINGNYWIRK